MSRHLQLTLLMGAALALMPSCKSVCDRGLERAMECYAQWCEAHADASVCEAEAREHAEHSFDECSDTVEAMSRSLIETGCGAFDNYLESAEMMRRGTP